MNTAYIIGTMDTKSGELLYARDLMHAAGIPARIVDVSTHKFVNGADISAHEIAAFHPAGVDGVLGLNDRGLAVSAMAEALTHWIASVSDVGGVLGLGGSGNTALVTTAMRALPVGIPKVMISTVASGNVAPYVGPTDITMMYSVTDIAGLNNISRRVIANGAHAVAGMMNFDNFTKVEELPGVGISMFGVTTKCVDQLRSLLEGKAEPFVFHATGTGGQSMEKLLDSGLLTGLLDVTATEVPDYLFGGVFPCNEDRYGATARTRRPWVGSVGAVDMVNFGARETVPSQFEGRNLYVHNSQVTLMRTTPAENAEIGRWIAGRLNLCEGPVRLLLPLNGVSAIDVPGMPFHDPEADAALFEAIRTDFKQTTQRRLIEIEHDINAPAFAEALVAQYLEIAE
ncbi:Tm-1-like ATP-binding domain-containing protein [Brucellaceae bacterium C25G]